MSSFMPFLLVGIGGFVGANGRFLVARMVGGMVETRFPLGTFVINVSGSFLLGVLGTVIAQRVFPSSEAMRLAIGVGFLGAFTTFSTFEFETHALIDDGSCAAGEPGADTTGMDARRRIRQAQVVRRSRAATAATSAGPRGRGVSGCAQAVGQ